MRLRHVCAPLPTGVRRTARALRACTALLAAADTPSPRAAPPPRAHSVRAAGAARGAACARRHGPRARRRPLAPARRAAYGPHPQAVIAHVADAHLVRRDRAARLSLRKGHQRAVHSPRAHAPVATHAPDALGLRRDPHGPPRRSSRVARVAARRAAGRHNRCRAASAKRATVDRPCVCQS
ncbi:hypothetical protein FGB62_26g00 [Gracilaria domingensis]|nr:hypothetical protein FGB62_26g00 [Gracilaria domingensis]